MGLSIAYRLALPAGTDRETVVSRMERLRERARHLPLALVTEMMATSSGESLGAPGVKGVVELEFWYRSWANLTLHSTTERGDDTLPESIGFVVYPGSDCEPAAFGLAWAPPLDEQWSCMPDEPYTWSWQSVCKTQYASNVSPEHFLACHSAIISLLDAARDLGFEVAVFDEAEFWETRDPGTLLSKVETMNELVAGLAGALDDALGDDHAVVAPIFSHPDLGRLGVGVVRPAP